MEPSLYQRIVDEYGTPVYVLDETELERSVVEIEGAFSTFPAEVRVAYPYKTNSLKRLCEYMRVRGLWAEVCSGLELRMALTLGVQPDHIVFNGPFKSSDELASAFQAGCQVNVARAHARGKVSHTADF